MSNKTLWHTITIKVPAEMVQLTKTGKISIKKTLTKTMNISKSEKQPSIKLVPSNTNKPEVINQGKEWDIKNLNEQMYKSNKLKKSNEGKNLFTINSHSKLNEFKKNVKAHAQQLVHEKEKKIEEQKQLEEETYKKVNDEPLTTPSINTVKIEDFKNKEILLEAIELYFSDKGQYLTNLSTFDKKGLILIIQKHKIKLTDLKIFYNKAIDNRLETYANSTGDKVIKQRKKWKTLYIL